MEQDGVVLLEDGEAQAHGSCGVGSRKRGSGDVAEVHSEDAPGNGTPPSKRERP